MLKGKIWRAETFGAPQDVIRLTEHEFAPPASGRLIVRVAAAGIALPDVLMVKGQFPVLPHPPIVPGQEVVGDVVEVAAGSKFKVGDRVMGMIPMLEGLGGCGDYAYVNESKAIEAPIFLTDEAAAGFLIAFRTAHAALVERVPIRPGQSIVVLGAAGSSGAAAIQLAKALGAHVVAVAGGEGKCAFCRRIGADVAINYKGIEDLPAALRDAVGASGADVIFDPVGGETSASAAKVLARGGRVAIVGYASGAWFPSDPLDMLLRNYDLCGVFAGGFTDEEDQAVFRHLLDLAADGKISTPVGAVSAFDDVPATIAGLQSPPPGKSVVKIAGYAR